MSRTGWIFPGQGAQSQRAGANFVGRAPFDGVIDAIAEISGKHIHDYILELDEQELRRTDRAQLAIFSLSLAIAACFRDVGLRPHFVAGHSLGHFSALAVAGVLRIEDAVNLVVQRGELMRRAGEGAAVGMGSVQGLDSSAVVQILEEARLQVWCANFNLPDQIVVSGLLKDLNAARDLFIKAQGKWMPLNVSGAFHCPLLAEEARVFAGHIDAVTFQDPCCPVISNLDGARLDKGTDIKVALTTHMTDQVHWYAVMKTIAELAPDLLIEVGSGKVLTGLMLRFDRTLNLANTSNPKLLDRAITAQKSLHEAGS